MDRGPIGVASVLMRDLGFTPRRGERPIAEIRRIAERNAGGVKETRDGTADLLRNAQSLTTIVTRIAKPH